MAVKNTNTASSIELLDPTRPSAEWTLDQLGAFTRQTLRKAAEVSWELGRALTLAKEKSKRKFGAWAKVYVPELSAKTIQRYMAVGRLDYDDICGKSIKDVYDLLWGETKAERKPVEQSKKASATSDTLLKILASENANSIVSANRDKLAKLNRLLTQLLA